MRRKTYWLRDITFSSFSIRLDLWNTWILLSNLMTQINLLLLYKQPSEVFCKKGVIRNFAKFTGKHLCQSLFFNKFAGSSLQLYWNWDSGTGAFQRIFEISKNTFFTEHLWATTSDFEGFMVDLFNIPSSLNKIKDWLYARN